MLHLWWWTEEKLAIFSFTFLVQVASEEAKLAIVFSDFFYFLLVQAACVRHPWWRSEVKLAIIFTYYCETPV